MNFSSSPSMQSWGIAVLRIVIGIVFLVHGAQKLLVFGVEGVTGMFAQMGFPAPALLAVLVIAAETLGSLALILGLFTRFAAIPLAITMLVAIATVHLTKGFFLPEGYEYTLTLLGANIALFLTGSGAFALDNLLQRTRMGVSPSLTSPRASS